MNQLVLNGINLNQHYTFKFCSPTRSSIQSGRNPIHVNVQNVDPTRSNPADPVSGFSAIARNMTGLAMHLQGAGYATAAVGKWDAGMATMDHTPEGRGYQRSLIYFHHANDYWQYTAGSCSSAGAVPARGSTSIPHVYTDAEREELNMPPRRRQQRQPPPQPGVCPAKFTILEGVGLCKNPAHHIWSGPAPSQGACCDKCAAEPGCVGWTFQNTSICFICNGTSGGPTPGRVSGCAGPEACDYSNAVTDLWGAAGPAHAMKPPPSCVQMNETAPWPANASCLYEDALFEQEVARIVAEHPIPQPLFVFWAPHIVHGPAQLPEAAFQALDFIEASDGPRARARQNYLGRVKYIDTAIGRLVGQLEARNMYDDSIIVLHADNGGPLGSANNYPLKGGKHSNWQGGVRVNAFISGGALPSSVRGTISNELITAWDWYATFVAGAAGVDPTDHRAALAGLPPIDSVNHWDYFMGKSSTGPRITVPLGSCTAAPDQDAFCQTSGYQQTIVNGMVAYLGQGDQRQLWKLLVGRIPLAGWTWPKYPNGSAPDTPTVSCGHPGRDGSAGGCLYNLSADPNERVDLSGAPEHAAIKAELFAMLQKSNRTSFTPNRGDVDPKACDAARSKYSGFWGPWIA